MRITSGPAAWRAGPSVLPHIVPGADSPPQLCRPFKAWQPLAAHIMGCPRLPLQLPYSAAALVGNLRSGLMPSTVASSFSSAAQPGAPSSAAGSDMRPQKSQRRGRVVAQARSNAGGQPAAAPPVVTAQVEDRELHVEASESYLAYAMSVIVGRALPDVRDGLKPVHRRILYAMHDMGISHSKPYKKCARVVGEVLGKYHPHGDTAVYDALVRLAQDFSMRHPLIAGHGNFGSLDDDPPAAMRYTECRLQALASDMLLSDLGEKVVDFVPTFDNSQDEPLVLPARIPHLLVNGTSGIAVGIATKIPPHNMLEVVSALSALIRNPDITVKELMQHVPGPDFPTGGVAGVGQGVVDAYERGSGGLVLRAKVEVEEIGAGRKKSSKRGSGSSTAAAASTAESSKPSGPCNIVITEVPYQTSKADLVQSIAELVESKVLQGVNDVRDESDRSGTRVVVELKTGVDPDAVIASLFKHTRLETRFACNMVALVDGSPKQLGLKDFLQHFLDFRCEVVERRARTQLGTAQNRLHLVEGFLAAMSRLDDVVKHIRAAADTAAAREALMTSIKLTQAQADAVLALPLRRLTAMERNELDKERSDLNNKITDLQDLLGSRQRVLAIVEQEAQAVAHKYGTPRRTVLVSEKAMQAQMSAVEEAAKAAAAPECLIMGSTRGFLRRVPSTALEQQNRGGKGRSNAAGLREGDALDIVIRATEADTLLLLTSEGKAYSLKASQVPEPTKSGYGTAVAQVLKTMSNVPMVSLLPLRPLPPHLKAAGKKAAGSKASAGDAVTADGESKPKGKRGRPAAAGSKAEPQDGVAQEASTQGADTEIGTTVDTAISGTQAVHEEGEDCSTSDAGTGEYLVLLTRGGGIKRTPLTPQYYNLRKTGVIVSKVEEDSDAVGWGACCRDDDAILIATSTGRVVLMRASDLRSSGRGAGPVRGVRLSPGQRVVGMAVVPSEIAKTLVYDTSPAEPEPSTPSPDPITGRTPSPFPLQAMSHLNGASHTFITPPSLGSHQGAVQGGGDADVLPSNTFIGASGEEAGEGAGQEGSTSSSSSTASSTGPWVLLVSTHGKGKRVPLQEFPLHRRGAMGVFAIKFTGRSGDELAAVRLVSQGDEVVLGSEKGRMSRLDSKAIRICHRTAVGSTLMDLADDDVINAVAVIPANTSTTANASSNANGGGSSSGTESGSEGGAMSSTDQTN